MRRCALAAAITMALLPQPSLQTNPPSLGPSKGPSASPSASPSTPPSKMPSRGPSTAPSASPSVMPSMMPTKSPTKSPTTSPTMMPSKSPSFSPTKLMPPPPPSPPPPSPPPPSPPPPIYPPIVDNNDWLLRFTMTSRTVDTFNKVDFNSVVMSFFTQSTSQSFGKISRVIVHWVCPISACPTSSACDTDVKRIDAANVKCRRGYEFPDGDSMRRASALQTGIYVDAQVVPNTGVTQTDATNSAEADLDSAIANSNAVLSSAGITNVDRENGWTDSGQTNTPANALTGVGTTGSPTRQSSDDDDGSKPWQIVLIVICCIICCLVLIVLVVLILRSRNKGSKGGKREMDQGRSPHKGGEMSQVGSDDALHQQPWRHPDEPVPGQMGANGGQQQFAQQQQYQQPAPQPYQPHSQPYASQQRSMGSGGYDSQAPDAQEEFPAGTRIEALYGDSYHPGEVVCKQENGMYTVNWDDASHSVDVPADTMRRNPYID
eukprot:TRINITY_DN1366_c7_g1_i1.p1 TRINITY_DN1366_c7_g1~~TRINITY_DN1366_c7_g1_i1.p1  ORF type:complete len:490 (+),score=154.76 TRINITY_DN1366_c7_g1_i1:83-1552(+)